MCMGNRKEEILIVALHLFARDGYEVVSVILIAGELDMTKGALYRHYKSKRLEKKQNNRMHVSRIFYCHEL